MSSGGPVEATIFAKLLEWAWAVVGVLMGIIWKRHNEEIAEIKGSIKKVGDKMEVHAKEFDQRLDTVERGSVSVPRFEAHEERTRQNIIELHRKIEGSEQRLTAKIEDGNRQILNVLLNRKD